MLGVIVTVVLIIVISYFLPFTLFDLTFSKTKLIVSTVIISLLSLNQETIRASYKTNIYGFLKHVSTFLIAMGYMVSIRFLIPADAWLSYVDAFLVGCVFSWVLSQMFIKYKLPHIHFFSRNKYSWSKGISTITESYPLLFATSILVILNCNFGIWDKQCI